MNKKMIVSVINKFYLITSVFLILINEGIYAASVDSVNGAHYRHNKRHQKILVPTLTVDVGPQTSDVQLPTSQEQTNDYYFHQNANKFNFSCIIKHPSFKYKMMLTREQILNSGKKSDPVDILDKSEYIINPLVKDQSMSIEYEEYNNGDERYLRVSLIITNLKISDTAIYKCSYSNIVKQIKVIVFKKPTIKDITFPKVKIPKVEAYKQLKFECEVKNVYPKPIVTFKDPNGNVISSSALTETDISVDKKQDPYVYSLIYSYNYTPTYNDNHKNFTCSVLAFGNNNYTEEISYKININGLEIKNEECSETYNANENDEDVKIECVYFSNPKVEPEWKMKVIKNEENKSTEPGDLQTTESPKEEFEDFTLNNNESSNHITSLSDEPTDGFYKSTLTIKKIKSSDFTNYTISLNNVQRVISLKREDKNKKDGVVESANSKTNQSPDSLFYSKSHSRIFISLIIELVIFKVFLNR